MKFIKVVLEVWNPLYTQNYMDSKLNLNVKNNAFKVNNEGQLRWLGPEKGVIGESFVIVLKRE